jgi:UDP-N-acetylmuramoyl-L-alanyl-D-glutamate--2,6-diaminopimelate ligase
MRRKHRSTLTLPVSELVEATQYRSGDDVLCSGCTAEVDHVQPGDLFVAMCDADSDTHEHAAEAIRRGAVAIVGERLLPVNVPQIVVDDARIAFGTACHRLAGHPSRALPVIGVTGSLGKTTTTLLTASVLNVHKQGVAAFSSLAHCDSVKSIPSDQSTPRADLLAQLLNSALQQGCSHAVVELSSAALAEQRTAGLELSMGVLTNLRRLHLDRHNSFAAYRALKQRMFSHMKDDAPLVMNLDDTFSRSLLEKIDRPVLTVGLHSEADVTAKLLERIASEQTFLLQAGADSIAVRTRMVGDHHIYNCLNAAAIGLLAGLDLPDIAQGLEAVEMIPGHMERVECGQEFSVFVDDARSHDALAMSLKTARQVASGRVICVLSPSDEMDPNDRPLLGKVLERNSQVRVITGETLHASDPLEQSHDVLDGFEHPGRAHVIPHREKAITWAMNEAQMGDVVVIAGSGHRSWQLGKEWTDDAAVARECLYRLAARELRSKPLVYAFMG